LLNQGAISDNSMFNLYSCCKVTVRALVLAALPLMLTGQTTPPLSFAGIQTTVPVSGLASPAGVAFDSSGNLFVLDRTGNQVIEVPANGSPQKVVASGLNAPAGIAADAAGNLYISNGPQVIKVPADGSPQTTLPIAGLVAPAGLAVDSSGNVYIADAGGAQVVKFSAAGAQTTVGSGWSVPTGIAVDLGGNAYVADKSLGYIVEIPAGGGTPVSIGTGLVSPISVAVDLSGNVMVGVAAGQIYKITPSAAQTTIGSGSFQPLGLVPRAIGTVFVADAASNTVVEIQTVSVDFGKVNLCVAGQTTPAPCNQSLTLSYNVNTTTTLAAPLVVTQGTPNLDFTLANGSTCSGSVAAGSTCSVNVTFTPLSPGGRAGAVVFQDTGGNLLAETFIHGIGNGAQIMYGPVVQTTLYNSPGLVNNLATDAAGNVYIAVQGFGIAKIPGGGGPVTQLGAGISGIGVAVDGAGNVYISNQYGSVFELVLTASGYGPPTPVPNFGGIGNQIAVDGAGNLFGVFDRSRALIESPAGGGAPITLAVMPPSSGTDFFGVALNSAGDIFVGGQELFKIPAGGGPLQIADNGGHNGSLAVDPAGNVIGPAAGIALDSAGNLYTAVGVDGGFGPVLTVTANRRSPVPPPAFSFATTILGHTSSDSPQSFQIANVGNQNLSFSEIGFASGLNFATTPGSGSPADCNVGTPLAPGFSCNLSLSFIPAVQGYLSDALVLTDNSQNGSPSTQSIQVTAVGVPTYESTTTSLQVSAAKISYSQPVTLTATVTTALGTPVGPVTFSSGSTVLGTAPLNAAGVATLTTTAIPVGSDTITASYAAAGVFLASTSTGASITVGPNTLSPGSANVCPAGQTKPAPCSQKLTLTYNALTTGTLSTPKVLTQGVPNLDYTLAGTTCSGPVTAGSTCTITIAFAPRLAGARPGAVQVVDSSGNVLQTFFLSGVGLAPQVAFNDTASIPLANSPQGVSGIAVDPAGNIYWASSQIMQWPAGGGTSIQLSNVQNGLCRYYNPIVVDGAGGVIFSDTCYGTGTYRIPAGGGSQTLIGDTAPMLAGDAASNVYYVAWDSSVHKIPAGGGAPIAVAPGNINVSGIAVDGGGNVYVSGIDKNTWTNEIVKFPAGGGTPVTVTTAIPYAMSMLKVDTAGDLFYLDYDSILEIPAGTSTPITVQSGLTQGGWDYPTDMALDASGNFYLSYMYSPMLKIPRANAPALTFASAVVKTASSDSPQSVQVQNIGDTALSLAGLKMDLNFPQRPGSGTPADCKRLSTLAAGALCNLSISFIPTIIGTLQSEEVLTDNSLHQTWATQSMSVSGTGIAKFTSTTSLSSSLNPSVVGQAVTFTATVSVSSGPAPTGTVTFRHSGVLGTAALVNGVATFTTSTLPGGTAEQITAVYSGNATTAGSSGILSQAVNKAAATVTLQSNINPSAVGQAVTFTATVAVASGPMPTGLVNFFMGARILGSAALTNGVAIFTTSALPAGNPDNITAKYAGNLSYLASTSNVLAQVVQ
jgi:sugar lactone lactonase YvrE